MVLAASDKEISVGNIQTAMNQKNGLVQRVPLFFQTLEREAEHVFIHACIILFFDMITRIRDKLYISYLYNA